MVKQSFWAWLQHTDNATHFKSKENVNFWSERPGQHAKWLKMVGVEFGCSGHEKGRWDGLGAMAKSKVTLDIMHGKERTSTGQITSAMLVAQHLRAIFWNQFWGMEHTDMKIQQVVVMYLNNDQISRPPAPPIVSPCKGIMSCYYFIFHGVPRRYARRSFSCWCKACSRVGGQGHGFNSCGANLMVPARRRLRPQRRDTTTTRGGGAWRPAYARRGPQADSRHGYQEVCTLRG
jgi:hypothetical protein